MPEHKRFQNRGGGGRNSEDNLSEGEIMFENTDFPVPLQGAFQ